ncbi:unnamed protein product [Trifolium pratense]|uniref:Uncharacterized protein n=1 Tax=Trifolium pratense TaxID=57577 RepID=A0ACB0KJA1_TRIPR|nr:unnamed protein product [Trifolium pratense]
MKVIFLATFLLIISGAQAISNEDEDFNMNNFTSKDKSISHSNEQAHELLGNLYGNGNIEVSARLNQKVVIMESNNEHKHKLAFTMGGGGRGGGFGIGRTGGAAAAGVGAGVGTGAIVEIHHYNSSATSLYAGPYFYASTFILCANFWL